ncbi:MAG: glucose-6-phosphate dehydrogenase [Acidobacteriota bacterium]|jgi:glucose-6-phosphate 1-dehydrogenase
MNADPFAADRQEDPVAPPCDVVIFGATGDLTQRKLLPALWNLRLDGLTEPGTTILGLARRSLSDDEFRGKMHEAVEAHSRRKASEGDWESFAASLGYHEGEFGDAQAYRTLAKRLDEQDRKRGTPKRRLFYFATPPSAYETILENLEASGLAAEDEDGFARVVIEKPFGHDLASARALNASVAAAFDERQVYRIDHYLGKETVQNILVFRLGNGIFEPLWNRRYVDHVQITVSESLGVEGRAAYYDKAGVLRDMLQNHLMQLLCLVAMEPPVRFEADAVRDEKVKVLRALRPPEPGTDALLRARYGPGTVGGSEVSGYLEEPGVPEDSTTETYLAARVAVENWRWAGVPFYLRSGKRLPLRATEIALVFRRPPLLFFGNSDTPHLKRNVLALRIQPDEGISLSFGSKLPGQKLHMEDVRMDFLYATSFGADPPEAYEHLLLDCIEGDSTLFARCDEVEEAWRIADAVRHCWERPDGPELLSYPAGTWGPTEAEALFRGTGHWRRI